MATWNGIDNTRRKPARILSESAGNNLNRNEILMFLYVNRL